MADEVVLEISEDRDRDRDQYQDILDDISIVSESVKIDLSKLNVETDKTKLILHVEGKIKSMGENMRYVNCKFEDIRISFKKYSILIIYLATFLTLVQALTNTIDLSSITNLFVVNFIKFFPLILSSLISLLAAIIKFNKYEEKIEEITRSNEKCIVTMAKLKAITEELYFCKENDNFQVVTNKYINNVYKEYLDSTTYIEKQLIDKDYARYMKKIANNDINYYRIKIMRDNKINALKNMAR